MDTQTVEFTVKMFREDTAKKVTLKVDFEDVPKALIRKHAMANMIVSWQGQIRNNSEKFMEDGVPEEVIFGQPLYAPKSKIITLTPEEMMDRMSPEEKQAMVEKLMASMGK